jgi:radical SAM-linked protein
MYYSEGFHPKPVMEFSPPLPLGVSGLEEYVDIALITDISTETLVERMREASPEGLTILGAERLLPGHRKLSRALQTAEYVVRVEPAHLEACALGPDEIASAPARFLARDTVVVEVIRKRVSKRADIRPSVEDVRWMDAADLPGEIPARPGDRYLSVRVRLHEESHARPEEVAAAMLGGSPRFEPPHITRTRLVASAAGVGQRPVLVSE